MPSHSMASVGPMEEKVDVAKTVTDDAIQKYTEFAMPSAESEIWEQSTFIIRNVEKLDLGTLRRAPVPKVYQTKNLVRGRKGQEEERSRSDTKRCFLGQLQLATFIKNLYAVFHDTSFLRRQESRSKSRFYTFSLCILHASARIVTKRDHREEAVGVPKV